MTRLIRPTIVDRLQNWIYVPGMLNVLGTLLLLMLVASTVTFGIDKSLVVLLMVAIFAISFYVAAVFLRRYDEKIMSLSFECLRMEKDRDAIVAVTRAITYLRAARNQDDSYRKLLDEYFAYVSDLKDIIFPKSDLFALAKCIFFLETDHGYVSPQMTRVKEMLSKKGYTFKL
jgi:hypothetical protein